MQSGEINTVPPERFEIATNQISREAEFGRNFNEFLQNYQTLSPADNHKIDKLIDICSDLDDGKAKIRAFANHSGLLSPDLEKGIFIDYLEYIFGPDNKHQLNVKRINRHLTNAMTIFTLVNSNRMGSKQPQITYQLGTMINRILGDVLLNSSPESLSWFYQNIIANSRDLTDERLTGDLNPLETEQRVLSLFRGVAGEQIAGMVCQYCLGADSPDVKRSFSDQNLDNKQIDISYKTGSGRLIAQVGVKTVRYLGPLRIASRDQAVLPVQALGKKYLVPVISGRDLMPAAKELFTDFPIYFAVYGYEQTGSSINTQVSMTMEDQTGHGNYQISPLASVDDNQWQVGFDQTIKALNRYQHRPDIVLNQATKHANAFHVMSGNAEYQSALLDPKAIKPQSMLWYVGLPDPKLDEKTPEYVHRVGSLIHALNNLI